MWFYWSLNYTPSWDGFYLIVFITKVRSTEGWCEVQRPAVRREAAADHLHDVLGRHQLGRHRALAL